MYIFWEYKYTELVRINLLSYLLGLVVLDSDTCRVFNIYVRVIWFLVVTCCFHERFPPIVIPLQVTPHHDISVQSIFAGWCTALSGYGMIGFQPVHSGI
jgi:hypothetical protein